MELIPSLPKYLAISLVVSLVLYFTGHILLSFFRQEGPKSRQVFFKYSIGLIIWVISFATIYSSFKTIMVGAWIILLYSVLYYQKHENFSLTLFKDNIRKIEWKYIALFSLLLLFIASYYVNRFGIQLKAVNDDLVYYAGVADYLGIAKVESLSFDILNLSQSPTFYHFFDSWLMLFLKKIFNTSSLNNLVYVIIPVYSSIIVLGGIALAETFFPGRKLVIYMAVGITLLFNSTFEEFFNPIYKIFGLENTENEAFIYINNNKLAIVYICVIWFFLNAKTNDFFRTLLPLSLVTILYPTTFPAIIGGYGLFFIARLIKTKSISGTVWTLGLLLIPALYTVFFFLFTRSNDQDLFQYSLTDTIKDNYESLRSLFLSMSIFLRYTVRLIISLAIYLAIIIIFYRKRLSTLRQNSTLSLIISIFVAGLITVCTIFYLLNSFQFINNLMQPILNISCFIFILMLLFDGSKVRRSIGIFLIILNGVFHFPTWNRSEAELDRNNYSRLEEEFKGQEFKIAYIKDSSSFRTIFDTSSGYFVPFPNIRRFSESYFPVLLSVFDLPEPKTVNEKYTFYGTLNESPFCDYVVENNLENKINKAQYDFLRLHTIDYMIVKKGSRFYLDLSSYNISKRISFENEEFEILKIKWD